MESNNQNKCTICSKEFSSDERISVDEDLLYLFTFVVCKLNTTTLDNTLICETCSGNIQKACAFKLLFLKTVNQDRAVSHIRKETEPDLLKCQICEKDINKCPSVTYAKESKFIIDYYLWGVSNLEANHACDSCKESILNLHSVTILLSNFENYPNNEDLRVPIESTNKESKIKNVEEPSEEVKIENDTSTAYENFLLKNEEVDIKMDEDEENLSDEEALEHSKEDNDVLECGNMQQRINRLCEFQTKDKLTRKNLINTKTYKRNVCKLKTKNKIVSKRHKLTNQKIDKNKLTCDVCGYKTNRKGSLLTHMLIHNNVGKIKIFKCDICGYEAKLKGNLTRHLLIHKNLDETQMFKCDICEFKTKHKSSLENHILIHKNVDEIEMFECAICGCKTKRKTDLKNHLLIHKSVDEIEMFPCNVCGYKTKLKQYLKAHMLIHKNVDEIEMFQCDICKYKTKRKSLLNRHMLVHKDAHETEIFFCDICDFKTNYKAVLKRHKNVHKNIDEIKMSECDVCGYKTNRKGSLLTHCMRVFQANTR